MIPTGTVLPFAGTAAPAGFVLCYGQPLDKTANAELFAVIGSTYNTGGEGANQYRVPDLRGRIPAGLDDMGGTPAGRLTNTVTNGVDGGALGNAGGEQAHSLLVSEMPAHQHSISLSTTNTGVSVPNGPDNTCLDRAEFGSLTTEATGSGDYHNLCQPTIILNYIIKL